MSYDPAIVANAVLHEARKRGLHVDHMKLQKLVFFMHAWGLALNDEPITDERPQAWTYGPVFDSLYHKLKQFGARTIDGYVQTMNPETGKFDAMVPNVQDVKFWKLLGQVLDRYGNVPALTLSSLTHEPGSPWDQTRAAKATKIEDDLVKSYYRNQLHRSAS